MHFSDFPEALDTPVLFIIFNRPETTRIVFEAIRQARPKRLYVAADGPRAGLANDAERCESARQIALKADWPCHVFTLFRNENLGCGKALSAGISWFFENEPEGIILEDDCLPSRSFFGYCQELLRKYRNDKRIMHIGGNNFLNGRQNEGASYYFSQCGHIWGWATWARAWKNYDFKMAAFPYLNRNGYFKHFFLNDIERFYRLRKLSQVYTSQLDTWDYQWDFARYINHGLSIVPMDNLVMNLGFGSEATHTKNGASKYLKLKANDIALPLKHPKRIVRDWNSDKRYFKTLIVERLLSKLTFS